MTNVDPERIIVSIQMIIQRASSSFCVVLCWSGNFPGGFGKFARITGEFRIQVDALGAVVQLVDRRSLCCACVAGRARDVAAFIRGRPRFYLVCVDGGYKSEFEIGV
jgi:hypothetical protein